MNCGNHKAATCKKCPWDLNARINYGKNWCNGDCTWKAGRCSFKQKGLINNHIDIGIGMFSKGKVVNCGNHVAATCKKCPWDFHARINYGKNWCNGDCSWKSGRCSIKSKENSENTSMKNFTDIIIFFSLQMWY